LTCSSVPVAGSEPLAIVPGSNGSTTRIESFANPRQPITLCTLSPNAYDVRFISRTEIGYAINTLPNSPIDGVTEVHRMSLITGQAVSVAKIKGDAMDIAWSPDGSSVAFLMYNYVPNLGSGDANRLWLKSGADPARTITPFIPLFGRGGSVDDETIVRFSADGQYLLMVDTFVSGQAPASPVQASFQVRQVSDGRLLWVPPSALTASGKFGAFATMAAWSHAGHRLYYRDSTGVHTWQPPSTVGTLAKGIQWSKPSVSPDGRFVAYSLDVGGKVHVEVRDLAAGSVRVLPRAIGVPLMLSDTVMLESHMVPNNQGPGPPYFPSGLYMLNLSTNVETSLGGNSPVDVWPH
jgi:hypothetical protein